LVRILEVPLATNRCGALALAWESASDEQKEKS